MFTQLSLAIAVCVSYISTVYCQMPLNQCGISVSKGNKLSGDLTDISDYPWLALIEYIDTSGKILLLCEGTLIHPQYVLTAGHCLVQENYRTRKPTNVRLGEYDTLTETDCIDKVCADAPQVIAIKDAILHPEYEPTSSDRKHDIALIRLEKPALFTDFVRSICLPTVDVTQGAASGSLPLLVAGWGAKVYRSNVKQFDVQVFSNFTECQEKYANFKYQVLEKQICAGGGEGKHSCQGGAGGPLMVKDQSTNTYTIQGVLSFGPTDCGRSNVPDVFTKVYSYLNWISAQIKT